MDSAARGAHRARRGTGHIVAAARLQLVYLTFTANRAHKPRFTTKIIETWAIIQRLQRFNIILRMDSMSPVSYERDILASKGL